MPRRQRIGNAQNHPVSGFDSDGFLGKLEWKPGDLLVLLPRVTGRIRPWNRGSANARADELFGYNPAELISKLVEVLIPERLCKDHSELRNHFCKNPRTRPMGAGRDLHGRRKDGSEVSSCW